MEVIVEGGRAFGLELNERHTDLFAVHARELLHWNKNVNLTRITDPFEVAVKHFVDSLACARHIAGGERVLDIGSGGGFPGIPLKVALPSLSVTLIDASRKKVNFLKHVIRTLALQGIEALHVRAEELAAAAQYRHRFDVIVSRALSGLRRFVTVAMPLLAEGGCVVAMKGEMTPEAVDALQADLPALKKGVAAVRGPMRISFSNYRLPFTGAKRSIVFVSERIR